MAIISSLKRFSGSLQGAVIAAAPVISMQTRCFFMTDRFGQLLILRPDRLLAALTEPFGQRSGEQSHEEGRFTFDGARRWAFGCHVDITGNGSCEERAGREGGDHDKMSRRGSPTLPREVL